MANPFSVTRISPTAVNVANQVKASSNALYGEMLSTYMKNYNAVWSNPAFTPDAIVTAMGTDAVKIFTASAALAALLTTAGATGIPTTMPAGWTKTENTDGSIMLTKTA